MKLLKRPNLQPVFPSCAILSSGKRPPILKADRILAKEGMVFCGRISTIYRSARICITVAFKLLEEPDRDQKFWNCEIHHAYCVNEGITSEQSKKNPDLKPLTNLRVDFDANGLKLLCCDEVVGMFKLQYQFTIALMNTVAKKMITEKGYSPLFVEV